MAAKIALIHFETLEIAKMLHNVYIQRFVHWEISFEVTFQRRFAVLALNVHGLRHRSKTISAFSRLVEDICDLN
jgi:hypothetical protein